MLDLDQRSFDEAVAGSPVVIDFWAPWCKPCLAIEPILEELSERITVARVNIDEEPELASRFEVLAVPTVMLFADGTARGTVHGARPKAYFDRWLAEVLPAGKVDTLPAPAHVDT